MAVLKMAVSCASTTYVVLYCFKRIRQWPAATEVHTTQSWQMLLHLKLHFYEVLFFFSRPKCAYVVIFVTKVRICYDFWDNKNAFVVIFETKVHVVFVLPKTKSRRYMRRTLGATLSNRFSNSNSWKLVGNHPSPLKIFVEAGFFMCCSLEYMCSVRLLGKQPIQP